MNSFFLKKYARKFICLSLLLFVCLKINATTFTESGITYYLEDDSSLECYVYRCTLTGDVTIPSTVTHNGTTYKVIGFGLLNNYVWSNTYRATVTSVSLPNTITSIGGYAFLGCTRLTSITIPSSVTSIGVYAFKNCSGLTSFSWPETITSIKAGTFYGCSGLVNFTIPSTVTTIGSSAFANTDLASVVMSKNILDIDTLAFNKPKKVTWLNNTIPDGVYNAIGEINYVSDESLATVIKNYSTVYTYPLLSSQFTVNGVIYVPISMVDKTCDVIDCTYSKSDTKLDIERTVSYTGTLGSITFSVQDVKEYACLRNPYFTGTAIVNNNGTIGKYAFSQCTGLNNLTVSNNGYIGMEAFSQDTGIGILSVKNAGYIGSYAFTSCSGITSMSVSNSSYIGEYAFSKCGNAMKAEIKNSGIINKNAFEATSIDTIYVASSVGNISPYAFYKSNIQTKANIQSQDQLGIYAFCETTGAFTALINCKGAIAHHTFYKSSGVTSATLGSGITSLSVSAFNSSTALTSITMDKGVTSLADSVFYNCSSLKSITIPESTTYLGNYSFERCSALTSATLNNKVTKIRLSTFRDCSSLTKITIPAVVDSIKNYTFAGCSQLKTVILSHEESNIVIGSNGTNGMFHDCALDSVYIGRRLVYDQTSTGGYSPFYSNAKLRAVTYSSSETQIYPLEFYKCINLKKVTIGSNITNVGDYAFYSCGKLPSIVIPNAVTTIGLSCFENCTSLKSETMGDGARTLGNRCFYSCTALTSAPLNKLQTLGEETFCNCTSLPKITIPSSVTQIPLKIFIGCTSLKTVVISDRTTTLPFSNGGSITAGTKGFKSIDGLGYPMFCDCPLDSVYIGGKISFTGTQNAGYSPFYYNTTLRSVVVADLETTVYANEFYECTGLISVQIGDGVTAIKEKAFSNCESLKYFSFGKALASIGANAFSDCASVVKITSKATTPPICGDQALDDINKLNCALIVPSGYLTAYQAADQWKQFFFASEAQADLTISAKTVTIAIGSSYTLTTTYGQDTTGSKISWSSSNTAVATVSAGKVTAKALGKATIYATATDNTSIKDSCVVTVTNINVNNMYYIVISEADKTAAVTYATKDYNSYSGDVVIPSTVTINGTEYGVTAVADSAFYKCTGLTSISIPSSITKIDKDAFNLALSTDGNYSFNAVYIDDLTSWCKIVYNNPFSQPLIYAHNLYLNGNLVTDLVIPSGVTSILYRAFFGCTSITSVYLPSSVTTMSYVAFCNCTNLKRVVIGQNVTTISSAFYNITADVYIQSKNVIDYAADYGFSKDSKIHVYTDVLSDYENSDAWNVYDLTDDFDNPAAGSLSTIVGTNPTSLKVSGDLNGTDIKYIRSLTNDYSLIDLDMSDANIVAGGDAYLGTYTTVANAISSYMFSSCDKLVSVTLPTSVTKILGNGFEQCSSLTGVVLPEGLTYIGLWAFQACKVLDNVTLPSSLTTIEEGAFFQCHTLKNILLPKSVSKLGIRPFGYCKSLSAVQVDGSNTNFKSIDGVLFSYDGTKLIQYPYAKSATNYIVPETATTIGAKSFDGAPNITSVTLPSTLTTIETCGLRDCANLTTVISKATTPPTAASDAFANLTLSSCTLSVPEGTEDAYKAADVWKEFNISTILTGDVNADGKVNITDAVEVVNNVLGEPSKQFVESLSDVNSDGQYTIADAMAVLNVILGEEIGTANAKANVKANANVDELSFYRTADDQLTLSIINKVGYSAFQFDFTLPEGMTLENVMLNQNRCADFSVMFRETSEGKYTVAVFNLDNTAFATGSGSLVDMMTSGKGDDEEITISNIHFSTTKAKDVQFDDLILGEATGINEVESNANANAIYDLGGRKLAKTRRGVNIVNGNKVIIK